MARSQRYPKLPRWRRYLAAIVLYLLTATLLWHYLPWSPLACVSDSGQITPLGYAEDGRTLLTYERTGDYGMKMPVSLWDLATGQLKSTYWVESNRPVSQGGPDGAYLTTETVHTAEDGAKMRTLRVLQSTTGT